MFRLFGVLVLIVVILLILRSRSKQNHNISTASYKKVILAIIIIGVLFFLATSGRYLLPQILQLVKIGIPLLTKFIGI